MSCLYHSHSGFFETHKDFFREPSRFSVFFLGIGGSSVSSLARYAHACGFSVSGSDRMRTEITDALAALGIRVWIGHRAENLSPHTDLLVYSLAVSTDAPEYRKALSLGIPVLSRAEFLGGLMQCYGVRIGVSGSHGKSTVTAMIAKIFSDAGRDPTVFSGAGLSADSPSYRFGGRETLIYEACEYRDSFLCFSPTAAVALNLELDHADYFPNLSILKESFIKSLSGAKRYALLSADDENLRGVSSALPPGKTLTFGFSEQADYRITDPAERSFSLSLRGESLGRFTLSVPGSFQISNAAAAIAAAHIHGIPPDAIRPSIAGFAGIPRRMQLLGSFRGAPVYYDYAHHPTEIRSVLSLVRKGERRANVVFRPHTFSRTKALFGEFVCALSEAASVILLPIDPVREEPMDGVSSELLAEAIGPRASALSEDALSSLPDLIPDNGGAVLLLGAANLDGVLQTLFSQCDFQKSK